MRAYRKQFTMGEQRDYEKSNAIDEVPAESFDHSLKRDIILAKRDTAVYRQELANRVSGEVCRVLGIPFIPVVVSEKRQWATLKDGKLRRKTLGRCWMSGSHIEIRNLTAVKGKRITNKVLWGVLCHELAHHLDSFKFNIPSSPHTAGFYKRIGDIDRKFGMVAETDK